MISRKCPHKTLFQHTVGWCQKFRKIADVVFIWSLTLVQHCRSTCGKEAAIHYEPIWFKKCCQLKLLVILKVSYSQKVFHFNSNLQKKVSNHLSSVKVSGLAPFFGDWSQSEKLTEFKPPLVTQFTFEFVRWLYRKVYLQNNACLQILI